MTPLTGRKRVLQRAAAVSFVAAVGLLLAGPALSYPSKPSPKPSDLPTTTAPRATGAPATSAPAASGAPSATAGASGAPTGNPTPPPGEPRFDVIDSPGVITCEDLGLGTTLMKVNGARKDHVQEGNGLSGVVRDTDVDKDGDPDSLFVTIDPGVVVTAIVYMHGNRGHIYESKFAPGYHGAFLAPPRSNNTEPPVNHWLICGPKVAASPTGSVEPTGSVGPTGSVEPTSSGSSPTAPPPGGGGLPVTGLALTGVVLSGLGMVGAGVAMRVVRRKKNPAEVEAEATESDDDKSTDV